MGHEKRTGEEQKVRLHLLYFFFCNPEYGLVRGCGERWQLFSDEIEGDDSTSPCPSCGKLTVPLAYSITDRGSE